MPLLVGNSNDIVIERMRVGRTGVAITDAVLTAVITDPSGRTIDTLTLAHEGDGDYSDNTLGPFTAGVQYKIQVDAASPYRFRRVIWETAQDPEL